MELIDKRKLQKDLAAYWGIPYDWDGEMDQLCEDALTAIDDADVIDAVEVVRCEDCRFLIDRPDGTHGCYRHFIEECKLDDFCSYGEK